MIKGLLHPSMPVHRLEAKNARNSLRPPRLAQAPVDLRRVMAGGLAKEARAVVDRAALGVRSRIIEPAQSGEGDRARAHHTRLECHVEIAADEPFGAKSRRALADNEHFRMRCWIAEFAGAVSGARDHGPLAHERGADRRFATELSRARLGESEV